MKTINVNVYELSELKTEIQQKLWEAYIYKYAFLIEYEDQEELLHKFNDLCNKYNIKLNYQYDSYSGYINISSSEEIKEEFIFKFNKILEQEESYCYDIPKLKNTDNIISNINNILNGILKVFQNELNYSTTFEFFKNSMQDKYFFENGEMFKQ